jgi:hypothetical protein
MLASLACGSHTGNYKIDYAGPIALQLVNSTSRPIEEILIYPLGAKNHGTSWASLAAGEATTVKIKEGKFELIAKSARRRVDARSTEVAEASTQLELREDLASTPRKLIFHDDGDTPAGVSERGTLGVTFIISKPAEEPEPSEPPASPKAP